MTDAHEVASLAATYDRVAAHLVGRERELTLALAAMAAGRDLILEGPPGTSKSTLLRAITAEWGIPLVFVEGNADLTPSKLIGHHNPARVLREDYSPDNFVPGSMRGERVRTAAATVGALAAELSRDDLAVVAFWSDAAILSRLGQHVPPQSLLDMMLRIPAKGLTNIAFPLQVAARELARVPARDARAVLLSDCVHNAGPDPRPFAARLPRLDVLLDTSGEQDADLARELARLGRGRLRRIDTYTDVAPALSAIFAH